MRPTKKIETKTITIEYWECLNPKHRHKSELNASKCIGADQGRELLHYKSEEAADKWHSIYILHLDGVSSFDLSSRFNISRRGIHEIIESGGRFFEYYFRYFNLIYLPEKVCNVLLDADLDAIWKIREAHNSGALMDVDGLGPMGLAAVTKWLKEQPNDKDMGWPSKWDFPDSSPVEVGWYAVQGGYGEHFVGAPDAIWCNDGKFVVPVSRYAGPFSDHWEAWQWAKIHEGMRA